MKIITLVAVFLAGSAAASAWDLYVARYVVGYAYYCGVLSNSPDYLTAQQHRKCGIVRDFAEAIR